jgi:hypothetical protein
VLTAATQDEHKRAVLLALVTTGLVLAAALGTILDPSVAVIVAALSILPLAAAYVIRFPWVALGLYIVIAPWVMRSTEIELGAGIPNLNFERLGIYGISALVLFRILVNKGDRLPFTRFDRAWLMLIGAMLLSGIVMGRTPPQTVRQIVNENIYPFALYFGMKHLVSRPKQVRILAIFLLLSALFMGTHAFLDQILGMHLSKIDRASITTHAQLKEIGGLHNLQTNRAGGPLGNSVVLGVSMVQGVVLGFFLLLTDRSKPIRALALIGMAMCGIGWVVTYTRSVYFALFCCGPLLWLWYPRFRKAIMIAGGVGFLVLIAYLPVAISDPENRLLNIGSIFERFGMWITSLYFIKASPLFGHGYGFETYPWLKTQNLVPRIELIGQRYLMSNTTPHDEFLRMTIAMGVIGLVLYCRFLWTMFGELNRFRKELPWMHLPMMRTYIIVAACGMIGFYGQGVFTDMTAMNYADTEVFLFLGAVLGVYENFKRSKSCHAHWVRSAGEAREPGPRSDPLNRL